MDNLFESRVNRFKGTLLIPNSGIQRQLARTLTSTVNNMYDGVNEFIYSPEYNLDDIEIDMNNIFRKQMESVSDFYMTQQEEYSKLVINRIVEQMYGTQRYTPAPLTVDKQEQENTINTFMLLPLFFFKDVKRLMENKGISKTDLTGIEYGSEVASEYRSILTKAKENTIKHVSVIADSTNFKDFIEKTQDGLISVGLTKAIWTARDLGQHKRYTHHNVMNGQLYDLRDGLYDPDYGDNIQCGQLNGCRCIPKIVSNVA